MARLAAAFLRHGHYHQPADVPSALLPHPLTPKGESQARAGAATLIHWAAEQGFTLHGTIHTSSLLRAWQTAQIFSQELTEALKTNFRVESVDSLTERSLGSAANLTLGEIEKVVAVDPRYRTLLKGWKRDSAFKLPFIGAESLMDSGERVAAQVRTTLLRLQTEITDDTAKIFIGHGGSFRHAAVCLGALRLEAAPRLSMHHCRPVVLEFRPDGSWVYLGGEWKVRPSDGELPD